MKLFFLPDEIIEKIFTYLNEIDKFSFIHINSYSYQNYQKELKYKIYEYITDDYFFFRKCLQIFKYDKQEILNLGIIAIENIRLIHESKLRLYYDLRFIFELVLLGFDINHKIVRKYYGINFILNKIRKSISFSRSETILNINNEISLRSLHYLFEPLLNDVLTYEKEGHRYEIYQKQWIYI